MNKKVELEYRTEIPIEDFKKHQEIISKKAEVVNHTKRFALMIFVSKEQETSILYIRTTKNLLTNKLDSEIVHKKGSKHSHDRIEITQKIDFKNLRSFIQMFAKFSADKKITMQRETVNFLTKDGINIALVKAKKHAYIEFEKMCDENEKRNVNNQLTDFIEESQYQTLNEEESNRLFEKLDKNDDSLIEGTDKDIEKILETLDSLRTNIS
jgi:hypothetical protein